MSPCCSSHEAKGGCGAAGGPVAHSVPKLPRRPQRAAKVSERRSAQKGLCHMTKWRSLGSAVHAVEWEVPAFGNHSFIHVCIHFTLKVRQASDAMPLSSEY